MNTQQQLITTVNDLHKTRYIKKNIKNFICQNLEIIKKQQTMMKIN